ncbi:MAG: RND family transporter [Psychrilyobacter sp.]|nr:RND family transporter [Psychrilyobacter sp.]
MKKLYNFPKLVIVIITLITLAFASQLPKIVIDNDVKIFLPDGHPARLHDDSASETFGSSDVILLGVNFKKNGILTVEHIKLIDELTKSFESLEHVHKVQALTNTDFIKGTSEGMEVEDIVKNLPQTQEDLNLIREKLLDWKPMYKKSLYTNDFKATTILVQFEYGSTAIDQEGVFHEMKTILKEHSSDKNIEYYLAGQPILNTMMGESMQIDMRNLIPFVLLIVIGSLYLSFRTISGVVLPLLTVIISTIWSLGLMAGMGIPLTMVSTIIPVLLIAVGSAYGIHIISHYYDDLKKHNGEISDEEHKSLVLHNVEKVGTAVFLAALTTIAGFGSLATSKIIPIKNFGLFTALGVFGALVVALTLIPCILLLKRPKLSSISEDEEDTLITKIMMGSYHFFTKRRTTILILTSFILMFSIYGTSKVVIDSIIVKFFKEGTTVRKADEYLNENFNGSNFINVVVAGTNKGDMTDPEILKDLDDMKYHFQSNYEEVGNVVTFADFIKRMNKAMNVPEEKTQTNVEDDTSIASDEVYDDGFGDDSFDDDSFDDDGFGDDDSIVAETTVSTNEVVKVSPSTEKISEADMIKILNNALHDAKRLNLTAEELVENINRATNYEGEAYNEVPYDPAKYPAETREDLKNLISQYLLLYSGELDSFTDDILEPKSTRVVFQLKTASNIFISDLKEEIHHYANENFPDGYTVTISGAGDMNLAVNDLIVSSQIWSIISSLAIVFIIVAFSFRSIIAGIFGIIPLILSLFINFGIMGFAGIKLDVGTAMVASIAIGIGVDYTIHFLSAYNFERLKSDDLEIVTKNTLTTSGKAIVFNAASVAFGFAVLVFSNFNPIKDLGLLICITMFTSSMGSMILLPILLNIFKPKFISKIK